MYSRKQVKTILNSLNIDKLNQLAREFGIATIENKSHLISNLLNRHKLFGGGIDDNTDKDNLTSKKKFHELGDPFLLKLLNKLSYSDIVRLRSTNKDINKKFKYSQFKKIIDYKEQIHLNRPHRTFKPNPNMIKYLIDRPMTLIDIARSINDGVYILYDNETESFDIFARSIDGVNRTINKLKSMQAMRSRMELLASLRQRRIE